jgi:hypothetical protein
MSYLLCCAQRDPPSARANRFRAEGQDWMAWLTESRTLGLWPTPACARLKGPPPLPFSPLSPAGQRTLAGPSDAPSDGRGAAQVGGLPARPAPHVRGGHDRRRVRRVWPVLSGRRRHLHGGGDQRSQPTAAARPRHGPQGRGGHGHGAGHGWVPALFPRNKKVLWSFFCEAAMLLRMCRPPGRRPRSRR